MVGKISSWLGAAVIALAGFLAIPVLAQTVIADKSGSVQAIIGAYPGMVQGSTITRTANTTAYAANQSVCGATTVTLCVPGTVPIAQIAGGRVTAKRVTLLKSGSSTTNANFNIWFYSAVPNLTVPNQFDATSYTGPRSADMPNYLGSATCSNGTATSDTSPGVWYECAINGSASALVLQAATTLTINSSGTRNVYYMLSAVGAYTPASAETFIPFVGGQY
jgi:hypothetical protein